MKIRITYVSALGAHDGTRLPDLYATAYGSDALQHADRIWVGYYGTSGGTDITSAAPTWTAAGTITTPNVGYKRER